MAETDIGIIGDLKKVIEKTECLGIADHCRSAKDVVSKVLEASKEASERKSGIKGLSTGFFDLDYRLEGLQKGNLILLAGRKWMGMTELALSIAHHAFMKENVMTAIFSPRYSGEHIMEMSLSMESNQYGGAIHRGLRSPEERVALEKSAEELSEAPLFIDDNPCLTIENIRKKCLNLNRNNDNKVGLVVVDCLQFLDCDGDETGKEMKKKIAKSLKNLAVEIDCPVIIISELSSDGEKKWNERSELCDIDDSDYTKLYADVILFLYMDKFEDIKEPRNREAEVILAKHRDGFYGKIRLRPDLGYSRFRNMVL
ncbi:MAG: DnaB-like helicase C-terminal domain-containing protein [Lachnospiraceae bacterium]|nr:DnaB-like helicase C-terminal domain-containing protein [Lachnospiraceae bacterium]